MSTTGVFACIVDSARRILLVRHAYGKQNWSTPGGRVEPAESPLAALHREILEEIGCEIRINHLIGVYAKPYRDDVVLSFAATIVSGSPRPIPPEISDVALFDSLPVELAFNARVRINDAFDRRRAVVRVFDSPTSLDSSCADHGCRDAET